MIKITKGYSEKFKTMHSSYPMDKERMIYQILDHINNEPVFIQNDISLYMITGKESENSFIYQVVDVLEEHSMYGEIVLYGNRQEVEKLLLEK